MFCKDKYYLYNEIEQLLKFWSDSYKDLFKYEVIGKSYEERDIWAVTITAKTKQLPNEKPAYYIDANHHAGEVTGSSVALYTIDYLLSNYNKEKRVTNLLNNYTFYIIPRISVDGSEKYLTSPYMLRSSVREYLRSTKDGTLMEDMNNDGLILDMRVRSSTGKYKKSSSDNRVMVDRLPDDINGEFYDIIYEGLIENYDGVEIKPNKTKWGLDFNRNYPANWKPEISQRGAGPYPLSEPETNAVANFILRHKNISGIMSYHTSGGILLRPYCTRPDSDLPKEDIKAFLDLGDIGEQLTSYPCWSIYEKFTVDKNNPSVGSFMDFAYDYLGIVTFAAELWDLRGRAGIKKEPLIKRVKKTSKEKEQESLKIMEYCDQKLNGEIFIDWQEITHPQLGVVEVGGYNPKFGRQNPPKALLAEESHKNMLFTLSHAESLPRIDIINIDSHSIADNVYKIIVDFANTGYLPTSGSKKAAENTIANKVVAKISNCKSVISNSETIELNELRGFEKKRIEWVITAKCGDEIKVEISTERAGTVKEYLKLK